MSNELRLKNTMLEPHVVDAACVEPRAVAHGAAVAVVSLLAVPVLIPILGEQPGQAADV